MSNRRDFLKITSLTSAGIVTKLASGANNTGYKIRSNTNSPLVISTWNHGIPANAKAFEILSNNGAAIDAVEAGVRVVESDPESHSVGLGGLPDRDGKITLDACIMDHRSRCGSVAFLQNIENPISVARKVMDETPHVMLAGKGAYAFAKANGFSHKELHTAYTKSQYKDWLRSSEYKPIINRENHDTISMLAIDSLGNIAGSCTTSGLAYKMHGRVGDSPIIGAGLFLDNEVGGACATGMGEAIIRVAGSAMVVEAMRYGKSPEEACKIVVERIIALHPEVNDLQAGFIAMNKSGKVGAYAIHKGFNYAYHNQEKQELRDSPHKL